VWYVLYEPFTNKFYRLPQGAYEFVSRLSVNKTVGEVWNGMLNSATGEIPGQGEVIEMLAQLYQSNMLMYDGIEDGAKLFERNKKQNRKKVKASLLNIFFLKVPLVDPDALLNKLRWLIACLISKPFALVWLLTVIVAAKYGVENFDALKDSAQGFLSPSNIGWVYVCTVFVKLLHEFGHASVVKRYGGEVHTLGVMFMLLVPLPYVDATASWSFRKKSRRILVGAAGMLTEFLIASIALILWANLGGGILKNLAYNVIIMASVSTVLFNINPLMRFDGYYMLTDLLDMPNLQQRSVQHLKYLLERYIFFKRDAEPVAETWSERVVYFFYGICSSVYRIFLFTGFIVAISQHYLLLSFFMGILLCLTMVIMPVGRFLKYIFASPGLALVRSRAVILTVLFFGGVFAFLFNVPVPDTFKAPGVMEARTYENAIVGESGLVDRIYHYADGLVHKGDTLMLLQNRELEFQLEEKRAQLREATQSYYQALENAPENMLPIEKRIGALKQELEKLEEDRSKLAVIAPIDGIWDIKDLDDYKGRFVRQGDSIGLLLDTSSFDFLAVVSQEEVSRLFAGKPRSVSVRLNGDAFTEIPVENVMAIPAASDHLPSAALGWLAGGEIETRVNNAQNGEQTVEPVYIVRAQLNDCLLASFKRHGRTGKIRFDLGETPLAMQGIRKVRQALQKYYRM
jgi:putative peptide zinc metalloprotease protein